MGKKDIDKDKDGENAPKLESVKVVLVHCNIVKNNYQQSFIYFCSKQTVWTVDKYFTTFFNDDEHNQYWIFCCWSLVYRSNQ